MCYSAAQCWISDTDFPAYARVGSTSLKKTDLIFNGFQSKVLGAFIHPFYQKFAKDDFDVALVRFLRKNIEIYIYSQI